MIILQAHRVTPITRRRTLRTQKNRSRPTPRTERLSLGEGKLGTADPPRVARVSVRATILEQFNSHPADGNLVNNDRAEPARECTGSPLTRTSRLIFLLDALNYIYG